MNLSHMRLGHMEEWMDAVRNEAAIGLFESMLEKPAPEPVATRLRRQTAELNLVRSGLDDTMRRAYGESATSGGRGTTCLICARQR